MQYLEQPIWNCLLLLLTGLKSYFCFVSVGFGDWSKLFCVFERWTCFAFFHPPLPVETASGQTSSLYKPYISFCSGLVARSQDLFWEVSSLFCVKGHCARMCTVFLLRRATQNTKLSSSKHLSSTRLGASALRCFTPGPQFLLQVTSSCTCCSPAVGIWILEDIPLLSLQL